LAEGRTLRSPATYDAITKCIVLVLIPAELKFREIRKKYLFGIEEVFNFKANKGDFRVEK